MDIFNPHEKWKWRHTIHSLYAPFYTKWHLFPNVLIYVMFLLSFSMAWMTKCILRKNNSIINKVMSWIWPSPSALYGLLNIQYPFQNQCIKYTWTLVRDYILFTFLYSHTMSVSVLAIQHRAVPNDVVIQELCVPVKVFFSLCTVKHFQADFPTGRLICAWNLNFPAIHPTNGGI